MNTLAPNGYNLQAEGMANPGKNKSKYSDRIDEIYDLLRNSDLNMTELAKSLEIPLSTLSDINAGTKVRQEGVIYPIRRTKTMSYNEYLEIIKYIKNTDYSLSQIGRLFNRCADTIFKINCGQQAKVRKIYDGPFPIRKNAKSGYTIKPVETIPSEIGSTPVIGT